MGRELIRIDGSFGEGGGQMVRTSLALATHLCKPIEIVNIRKSRRTPGLMPQHLTAVRACRKICGADVKGDRIKSEKLEFYPKRVRHGKYTFDIAEERRSAGSATLVLQTILLPLFFAGGESSVKVKGGTHVPWSPPATYLKQVFLPTLGRIGLHSQMKISRWGWYPEGGGEITCSVKSAKGIRLHDYMDRGKFVKITGVSAVSNLQHSIAERQRRRARQVLRESGYSANIGTKDVRSSGKGTILFLTAEFEKILCGFSTLGEKGKPAEVIAEETVTKFIDFVGKDVCIGHHLADQLLPYLCLARRRFKLNVSALTTHLITNLWVIKKFFDLHVEIKGPHGYPGYITVEPKS
jgi:RNA 3'-terminal phosphate cyclase (ATP)